MIDDQQQRPAPRNALLAFELDVAIVPAQGDACDRAKQRVDHRYAVRGPLSGTPRKITAAITNIPATVMTAARYAIAVPSLDSSPSTVKPQINGPSTAAARDDNNIKLKYRPA